MTAKTVELDLRDGGVYVTPDGTRYTADLSQALGLLLSSARYEEMLETGTLAEGKAAIDEYPDLGLLIMRMADEPQIDPYLLTDTGETDLGGKEC